MSRTLRGKNSRHRSHLIAQQEADAKARADADMEEARVLQEQAATQSQEATAKPAVEVTAPTPVPTPSDPAELLPTVEDVVETITDLPGEVTPVPLVEVEESDAG